MVQRKSDEWTRLEQEVVNLRIDLEKEKNCEDKLKKSSTKLDDLIARQKPSKDKGILVMEVCESSKIVQTSNIVDNQKTKDKGKHKRNSRNFSRRPPIKQPNAQRYPSFNSVFFSCNKFGHKARNEQDICEKIRIIKIKRVCALILCGQFIKQLRPNMVLGGVVTKNCLNPLIYGMSKVGTKICCKYCQKKFYAKGTRKKDEGMFIYGEN